MAKIMVEQFAGELPKMEPRYLPPTHASLVRGARLNRGHLSPMRDGAVIDMLGANASRIYLHGSTFLGWNYDVDAVPGPVAQDRLYITREALAPQLLYSGQYYKLELPNPTGKPTLENLGTADPELSELVVYAFTWVTSLGEESGPSPLSNGILWSSGNQIVVTMPGAVPANRLITGRRIYRSQTSASGATELFFVADVLVEQTAYTHNVAADPLQTAITTSDAAPAPDALRGLTALPNGMMAGFVDREVWFCEPYLPHSWPSKYVLAVNDQIVGLCAFGSSLAVLTTGTPYVAQGLHPDAMAMQRLEIDYPCISKRGIVDMGYAAVYPSTDGLVQIGQNGATLISEAIWDREQWQALSPATFRASRYIGRYAFSYQPGGIGERKMAYVDTTGQMPFLLPVDLDPYLDLINHVETGRLIGLMDSDNRTIVSIDDGTAAFGEYRWLSKPFFLPAPISMGVLKVDAKPTPGAGMAVFEAKVYRDGVLIRTITSPANFARLPADRLGEEWQVEVSGNMTVTKITICQTPDELWQT